MRQRIHLKGINDAYEGKVWASESILHVGRLPSLEIVLNDRSVSRRHALVGPNDQGWWVRDLGSMNGTFHNGVRMGASEIQLHHRDLVQFGKIAFLVELIEAGSETAVAPAQQLPLSEAFPLPCSSHASRTIAWKAVIPGRRPLATPAVVAGKVFLGGGFGSHEFYAFDAATGQLVWEYRTHDDGPTAAVVADELIAFNTESCELEILTFEGKSLWKKWLGDPLMSMPAIGDGRVYMAYPNSREDRRHYLACFDLRTGMEHWKQPISGEIITAPVLAGGQVYLACLDGTLACFRQDTGQPLWQEAANATSSPVVWNGQCYFSRRQEVRLVQAGHAASQQTESLSSYSISDREFNRVFRSTTRTADYLDYAKRKSHSPVEHQHETIDSSVGFGSSKGHSKIDPS